MEKVNCWEYFDCGRQPGGNQVSELGICPVIEKSEYNGLNNGKNGGRICWAVSGTLCPGGIDGLKAKCITSCMRCEFYHKVEKEETNSSFKLIAPKSNKAV